MLIHRLATPADHARLIHLSEQDPVRSKNSLPHLSPKNSKVLVAEYEDDLRGYLVMRISNRGQPDRDRWLKNLARRAMGIPRPETDAIVQPLRVGLIEDIYVAPAWRRQGIATALAHHAVGYLQADQVDRIQTVISADYELARKFFGRLNFAPRQLLMGRRMPAQLSSSHKLVRPATRQDLQPLAELVQQEVTYQQTVSGYFDLVPRIDWEQVVLAKLAQNKTGVLIVKQDDRLAGYVEVRLVQPGMYSPTAHLKATMSRLLRQKQQQTSGYGLIEDIYVLPAFRRRGLATVLLQQGLQWLKDQRITEVQAAIWQNNEASKRFFRQSGFEPVKLMLINQQPPHNEVDSLEAEAAL